jgi:phytoene dehydrogenase-like protein
MSASERVRVAVVGAGAGGLVAAAYLAKAGVHVEVFEAQAHVGGCASCFTIGGNRFHAGATTLVGLEPHMPLARMLDELDLAVPHHRLERAMAIARAGETIRLAQDNAANAARFERTFGHAFGAFWAHAAAVAPRAWSLIAEAPVPPKTFADLAWLATSREAWALLPELLTTTRSRLEGFGQVPREGIELLDELLLVSTQATSARTPALFGAVGCEYLERPLYMPHGGLGALFELVAARVRARGALLHLSTRVDAVRVHAQHVTIEANGTTTDFDAVVLGLTCWDAARLVHGAPRATFERQAKRHRDAWSAAGGYFVVDDVFGDDAPVYTQVVLERPMRSTGARGFFVTVPPREDRSLVPNTGERTLTVSCHTESEPWFSCDDSAFRERRSELLEEIEGGLRAAIPALAHARVHARHPATPRTWQSFTGRHLGRVGGLPFARDLRTLAYPTGATGSPHVVAVGDTVFPGQSVTATAIGARRGALALLAHFGRSA